MMEMTLAQLFKKSRGKPVAYENKLVHAAVFRNVVKSGRFIVQIR